MSKLSHQLTCDCSLHPFQLIMSFTYSILQLYKLNTPISPFCISIIKKLGLLRRPRYIHRSSRRKIVYSWFNHNIPSIWSNARPVASCLRHHTKQHVRSPCLQTLVKSDQTTQNQPLLRLVLFNTRSLSNKGSILSEFILDNNLDFLCLTETWQKPLECFDLNQTAAELQ